MKVITYKKINYIIAGIILLAILIAKTSTPPNYTQGIISLINLNINNCKYIEKDFNKMRGVNRCDVSILTNTLIIEINDRVISKKDIETILRKWGCSIKNYSFEIRAGLD